MVAANDNGASRNLEIAIWKMLRAGMPKQVIISTLGLTGSDLARFQTADSADATTHTLRPVRRGACRSVPRIADGEIQPDT
jgi:hypothetical protein